MSGHFATLLRDTVRTLLRDHDVYVTDWHNVRDVPLSAGRFGLDEYIEHLIEFTAALGPGANVVAICQPCVAALAAAAIMAEDDHPAQPASLTLMAGPIDCRIGPTAVNKLATSKPIGWFEKNLIGRVPWRLTGAGRRVYPGFLQLSAFISMNRERHVEAFRKYFAHLAAGEEAEAKAIGDFYNEYMAVADLSADFYLETVRLVFQEYALPLGRLTLRGRKIDPTAIRRTALLTVEGERDDICAIGQTLAAQELTRPAALAAHPPRAAERRPLRRLQRPALAAAHLPGRPQRHPGFAVGAGRRAGRGVPGRQGRRSQRAQSGEAGIPDGIAPPPRAACAPSPAACVAGFFRSRTR